MTMDINQLRNVVSEHWRNKFDSDKFQELCAWVESQIHTVAAHGLFNTSILKDRNAYWPPTDFHAMINLDIYLSPLLDHLTNSGFKVKITKSPTMPYAWGWSEYLEISWASATK